MKHKMKLNDKPYQRMKSGTKTIELRLNDKKRQLLNIGDLIEFTNIESSEKLVVEIKNLYHYPSFDELYKHFNKISIGYTEEEVADPKDMNNYYSSEEQEKYGVLGIEIKIIK